MPLADARRAGRAWALTALLLALAWTLTGEARAAAGERVALVVGNSAYPEAPLRNPVNDARDMSERLSALGFRVTTVLDADLRTLERAIVEFTSGLGPDTAGLFYYAGHGIQVRGRNYLVPIDGTFRAESDVRISAVDVDLVLSEMEYARNRVNVVILDACRNNPFERRLRGSASRGLAAIDAGRGTLIAYATAPGSVAADGDGDNGLYTRALLSALSEPGLPAEQVFKRVRVAVADATDGRQIPWESSSLTGDFVFNVNLDVRIAEPTSRSVDVLFWESIKDSDHAPDFEAYLAQFPEGTFAALARNRIALLQAPASATASVPDRIEQVLALADADLQALRLTSPPGNNAVEKLREALALDPDNARAHRGLGRVVERYLELSARAVADRAFDRALTYLDRAEQVSPGSEAIAPARAGVEAARQRHVEALADRDAAVAARTPPGAADPSTGGAEPEQRVARVSETAPTPATRPAPRTEAPPEPRALQSIIIPGRMNSGWNSAAIERALRFVHGQLMRGVLRIRGEPEVDLVYHPLYAQPRDDLPPERLQALWGGRYSSKIDVGATYALLDQAGLDLAFTVHVATGSSRGGGTARVILVDARGRRTYEISSSYDDVERAVAEVWQPFVAQYAHTGRASRAGR